MKRSTSHNRVLLQTILFGLTTFGLVNGVRGQQHTFDSSRITKSFTEPIEKSIAACAETGIISSSFVKEGDRVEVGEPLAELNQVVLQRSLTIATARSESTAQLDTAASRTTMLKSQLDALNSLVKGGHTNRFEVDQKQSEYLTAHAEYRTAKDELKLAKLEVNRIKAQIADRVISSPIDGVVTEIHKQLGENISNNEPQYATIVRVDELKVRFYLDADTLKNTVVGDQVTVHVGRERDQIVATVIFVSPVIDPDSGLGRLEIKIANHDNAFQSGAVCFWGNHSNEPPRAAKVNDASQLLLNR